MTGRLVGWLARLAGRPRWLVRDNPGDRFQRQPAQGAGGWGFDPSADIWSALRFHGAADSGHYGRLWGQARGWVWARIFVMGRILNICMGMDMSIRMDIVIIFIFIIVIF